MEDLRERPKDVVVVLVLVTGCLNLLSAASLRRPDRGNT